MVGTKVLDTVHILGFPLSDGRPIARRYPSAAPAALAPPLTRPPGRSIAITERSIDRAVAAGDHRQRGAIADMDAQTVTRARFGLIPVLIALLLNLVLGPLTPTIQKGESDVLAAPESVNDQQGANDEPGQKDLTKLTIDYAGLPTSVAVSWNWDEVSWSGSNTGDACALFDTDDDLFVDAAVCVTVSQDPAQLLDVRLYECTADAKVDRCTGPQEVAAPANTDCTVAQTDTDPFPAGAEFPTDTTASCVIYLSEVAATDAELVNVCSFPSEEPNSDPSDCVLIIRDGVLHVTKVVVNDNGGSKACTDFTFQVNGGTAAAFEADCTTEIAVEPGSYSVTEPAVSGYTTTYSNTLNSNADCNQLAVGSGDTVTCTITNNDQAATLTVTKVVTNDDGGTATCDDFTFTVNGGTPVSFEADCTNVLTVSAGTYSVVEPAVAGYATTYSNSLNSNLNCSNLAIASGGSATCTITNDDEPGSLTVTKVVTNDDGGTASCDDFSFSIDGGTPVAFEADCTNVIEVDAGTYSVTEPAVSGYTTTYSNTLNSNANCDNLAIALDGAATCTITNNDQAATLTVTKAVSGGDLTCDDFTFTVNGGTPVSFEADCTNVLTVDAGTYSVFEPTVAGYTTTYANSLNSNLNCTSLTLANGGSATCTITNTRDTGSLTVIKNLEPSNDSGRFNLEIDDEIELADAGDGGSTGAVVVDTGTHTVGESAGTNTSLTNYASSISCVDANNENQELVAASGSGPLMVEVAKDDNIVCTITNTRVVVGFSKANDEGDNAAVEPGETIRFTLTVTVNTGTATNVEVTDTLPDGLTYVEGSATPATGFTADGQDLTWTVATLGAGSHEFVYDARVDADASGSLTNLGCVDVDQNPAVICDETTLRVQNVSVTKTNGVSGSVIPGTAVDFTLTLDVENGPIDDVTIVDQLPAQLGSVVNVSDGGTYNSTTNRITWNLQDVADGETLTYTATVSATASAGSLTNVATITEGPCVGDGCDDDSTIIVRVASLVVDKVASTETITISGPSTAPVATPSVVTWTLSYTLTNGPVTGAVITDQVPAGFTFLDAANGGTFANGTVTWNLGTLTASGSVSFRTTVNPATISRVAPTVNTAVIDSNETAPDNGQDSVTVTVIAPPLAGNPTPRPPLPNTAAGIGPDGSPVTVPIELLVAAFIGSLGALALANAKARARRS